MTVIQDDNELEQIKDLTTSNQRKSWYKYYDDLQEFKTQKLKESMNNENCELISEYEKYDKPVYYLYEGLEYKTTPNTWYKGVRAHKMKCIRYTTNYVKEMLKREGCELIGEYVNTKTPIKYTYNGKEYSIRFDKWKYNNRRNHI